MKQHHFPAIVVLFVVCAMLSLQSYAQLSEKGVVASATGEATEAGAMMLDKGGNAVDAAVATAFALGVTEPAMSGLGGRTMVLISKNNEAPVAIGSIALTPSFVEPNIEKKDLDYYKQIAIPSQLKVLNYIWSRYGSGKLEWAELLEPAISYAENGFVVGEHRHYIFKRSEENLMNSSFHNKELLIDGRIPARGDLVKQPTLAVTLKRIARYGAEDFYKGSIAKEIAEDIERNGGWITYEDLVNFPEPKEYKPVQINYKGYEVYSFVPPSGGWGVLLALNAMKQLEKNKINSYSFARTEQIMKVLNVVHNDRRDYPLTDMVDYKEEVSTKLSDTYAKNLLATSYKQLNSKKGEKGQGETTHVSIVDKDGMCVSMTSSVGGYFGSVTSSKELGFFYNSYVKSLLGFGFGAPKPIESSAPIPSSMSPSLVKKDGQNVLVIGTPGSKRIVSTIAQLIQLWIDTDKSITELIAYPRIHAINNEVYLEDMKSTTVELQKIRDSGFNIVFPDYDLTKSGLNAFFGGVHAVEYKNKQWKAAADPRRDGSVSNKRN